MYKPRAFNLGSSGFGRKAEELAPLRFIQITDVYWVPTEGAPGAENAKAPGPQGGSLGAPLRHTPAASFPMGRTVLT